MSTGLHPHKILTLRIGDHDFRIAHVENADALFEDFLKKNKEDPEITDERIPYWGELWPSAIGLSKYISENTNLVEGKSVLEIGCGLGLSGIVAAKFGGEVLLTDYLPEAIEFAIYNWNLNFRNIPNARLFDWRNPDDLNPFDVVIASDVAYESRAFDPLISALKHLVKENGIILISEPNRKFAKKFFEELRKNNFRVNESMEKVFVNDIEHLISIYLASPEKSFRI